MNEPEEEFGKQDAENLMKYYRQALDPDSREQILKSLKAEKEQMETKEKNTSSEREEPHERDER